jgi:hypothetical protein
MKTTRQNFQCIITLSASNLCSVFLDFQRDDMPTIQWLVIYAHLEDWGRPKDVASNENTVEMLSKKRDKRCRDRNSSPVNSG